MNARELALDLMQLDPPSRNELLAELPAHKRAEMMALIHEAETVLQPPTPIFETQLQEAEKARKCSLGFEQLNEGQLRLLLSAEPPSVQQRVVRALRTGEFDRWPASVREVVIATLRLHQQSSQISVQEGGLVRPRWWQRLSRRKRK